MSSVVVSHGRHLALRRWPITTSDACDALM
jgi:hypothetical protein